MENYKSIEQILSDLDTTIVYKTKDSIWKSLFLIITGGLCFLPVVFHPWASHSMMPPLLIVVGTALGIVGLLRMFAGKEYFVGRNNRQRLKESEICFDISENNKLVRLYNSNNINYIHTLKRSRGGALRIRIMATKDRQLCFSQVIGYESLSHVPLTAPTQHDATEADYLLGLLR